MKRNNLKRKPNDSELKRVKDFLLEEYNKRLLKDKIKP